MINLKEDKYTQRLIKEWLAYGKIVLAIDFDDTIRPWGFTEDKDQMEFAHTISIIKLAQSLGTHNVIWTACDSDRFEEIRKFCSEIGINVDEINNNPIKLPYGNDRKIYYNHLLDDRAGLKYALEQLEFAYYTVFSSKHSSSEQTVEF